MNLILIFESIKFYKVKHERLVQVAFVLLYFINIAPYYIPIGNPDFSAYFSAVEELLTNPGGPLPMPSAENLITLGLVLLVSLINLFVTFGYAALMAGEQQKKTGKQILIAFITGLPRLAGFLALMAIPLAMSSLLLMLPVLFFITNLYVLPTLLLSDRQKLMPALHASVDATKGYKMAILLQIFFLSIILSLPETLILNFVPDSNVTAVLIPQFFIVLQAFAQGRLMGAFHLFLVKKVPVMIPSKPQL